MKKMRRIKQNEPGRIGRVLFLGISLLLVAFGTGVSGAHAAAAVGAIAQIRSTAALVISGKVTDAKGIPLIGVSIREKGTTNGVSTKQDGSFSIRVANDYAILEITYVGFKSKEVPVRGLTVLNIVLEDAEQVLEEVVVRVGYGTQKKADVTGAVASVNLEAFKEAPNSQYRSVPARLSTRPECRRRHQRRGNPSHFHSRTSHPQRQPERADHS